jgi:hypothetical protein
LKKRNSKKRKHWEADLEEESECADRCSGMCLPTQQSYTLLSAVNLLTKRRMVLAKRNPTCEKPLMRCAHTKKRPKLADYLHAIDSESRTSSKQEECSETPILGKREARSLSGDLFNSTMRTAVSTCSKRAKYEA